MYTKLYMLEYAMDQNVMVHGVMRPSLRGVPHNVKEEEVNNRGELETVRYTVKAAILKGYEVL